MRILITGSGMLGSALAQAARARGHLVTALAHRDWELTEAAHARQAIHAAEPDLIFHTAALTKVNFCEDHPEAAYAVNRDGTEYVAAAAQVLGCRLVYFSTDYVFDGTQQQPWVETDAPNPVNVYGASKFAGESAVSAYSNGVVVRTSGIFGSRTDGVVERNFFRAVCAKLLTHQQLTVVQDQLTALTSAGALAAMVLELIPDRLPPLAHIVCGGSGSWYEWACLAARSIGVDQSLVQPITVAELGSPRVSVVHRTVC